MKNNATGTLATTALQLFRDNCFNVVHEKVRGAILNQITKDRNNEMVDIDLIKKSIDTFVDMGIISADIVKHNDEFMWNGNKNNDNHYGPKF